MESFLQSIKWANFQESIGRKVYRMGDINIIKHNLPLKKNYLYCPHFSFSQKQEILDQFLKKIKQIAKKEKSIFIKIEPLTKKEEDLLKEKNFKKGSSIQPTKSIVLDLTKTKEQLLEQMHHKTRYNIRLAKRKKITIHNYTDKKDFEDFWNILNQTAKRNKFATHEKEYYRKMLNIPGINVFIAKKQNKTIAANIVLTHKQTAVYLHGASDYKHRKLMAPHLLQWTQIKEAKKQNCVMYDFWGIDKDKWPGVTRFKKGFGGREVNYPGAYDLPTSKTWYLIYKTARKIL
ncbi:MAG: peptidoglycan bridge formation glycyltransferase FemA/FemB family protein [Candidatus Portnoybacteria bacterium]|nr:peptidoglycan bridge formation glycyltransferase FemA/FemB family protein [Candidatus Portnoybacteria bacterium]